MPALEEGLNLVFPPPPPPHAHSHSCHLSPSEDELGGALLRLLRPGIEIYLPLAELGQGRMGGFVVVGA